MSKEYLQHLLQVSNEKATISGKRRWAAVPAPIRELASLHESVTALKQRTDVQARETGDSLDSFLTVRDLMALGLIDAEGRKL